MRPSAMRDFWDERAAEDPFYFVDNRLRYRDPDPERFWRGGEEGLAELLRELGATLAPTDDVVEIGCGIGRMTRALAARVATVRALDVSPRMLAIARRENAHLDNVEWLLGDGASLAGIADESADFCHSDVVFQHIPDPEIQLGYVAEIGRVLRPAGRAAFQISNAPEIHRLSAPTRVRVGLAALLRRGPRGQNDPAWRGAAIDLERLRAIAAGAGMEVAKITGEGSQYCRILLRKG